MWISSAWRRFASILARNEFPAPAQRKTDDKRHARDGVILQGVVHEHLRATFVRP